MNGVEWLDDYQDAVVTELAKIPWAVTTGVYPDIGSDFPTPAIFFDVARWERAERELGGNVTLSLTCHFYILRHFVAGQGDDEELRGSTETRVRNAALKMSDWVEGRQFGTGTAPAVMESAEPMTWENSEGGADHAIWSVSFTQLLAVGRDPFEEPDLPRLKEFWLGVFPDIGPEHKEDYALLAKSGDD